MKKIFITGAAGFIGYHLSKRMLDSGMDVYGIDNMNDYYDVSLKNMRLSGLKTNEHFRFAEGDIADRDEVEKIFSSFGPDIVVNLAAQAGVRYSITNPDSYIQSNIIGFYNILECCRRHKVEHLVFASSSSVYGGNRKVPYSEADKVDNPVSLYAATKKSDELLAYSYSHLYDIPATGLRFFTVYGPLGRPDMAYFKFAEKIMHNEPIEIYNNGDMLRDFTYIDDIAEGISRVMAHVPTPDDITGARYKIYNIGNHSPVRLMDFITTLEKALGHEAVKEFRPMQPGDVYQTYADVTELMKDVGFKPETPIETGMQRFADWYIEDYYKKDGK
jgi:UDP-glucuronate 4-epimerase